MIKKDIKIIIEIVVLLLVISFHFISEWFCYSDIEVYFFGLSVAHLIRDIILYLIIGLVIILILLEVRESY